MPLTNDDHLILLRPSSYSSCDLSALPHYQVRTCDLPVVRLGSSGSCTTRGQPR